MPERQITTRPEITPRSTPPIETTREVSSRPQIVRESSRILSPFSSATPPSDAERNALNQRINQNIGGIFGSSATNIQANDSTGNGLLPIYGSGSPFDILGDAFLRAFGGSTYQPPRQSERTVIESAGGGGGNIGILVILGAVGFGIYYFFIRK